MQWFIPEALVGASSVIESRAKGITTNIPVVINTLMTGGYYSYGDGGGAQYKRVVSKPTHAGKFQSADGAWWELCSVSLNVKMFGAKGDGATDDLTSIQNAVDFATPYAAFVTDGIAIAFPSGIYNVSNSIDLTLRNGVYLKGDGPKATEIKCTSNNPVIKVAGDSSNITTSIGVTMMTIRGFGNADNNAHGISLAWVSSSCFLTELVIFSCYYGIYLSHNWQTAMENIRIYGAGSDRSYIGVYMDATDLTYIDNAVNAFNVNVQQTSGYGFRIINGQGSKFVACEAGGSPMIYAWYIGDPPSGTVKCQWMHFVDCLGDSTSAAVWLIRQGGATEISQMQFSNCWAGNGEYGFYIDGAKKMTFGEVLSIGNTKDAFRLVNSSKIIISGAQLLDNNEAASNLYSDVTLQGSTYCIVSNCVCESDAAGKGVLEIDPANGNVISYNMLFRGATIVGANTIVDRNPGFITSNRGTATVLNNNTTIAVNHGLAITPPISAISVTPNDNLGSASKFWVSGVTSTQFVINVDTNPGADKAFSWNVNLATLT